MCDHYNMFQYARMGNNLKGSVFISARWRKASKRKTKCCDADLSFDFNAGG